MKRKNLSKEEACERRLDAAKARLHLVATQLLDSEFAPEDASMKSLFSDALEMDIGDAVDRQDEAEKSPSYSWKMRLYWKEVINYIDARDQANELSR